MEFKEGSSILNNIQAEESKKQRSQRKRKPQENQYKNFLEFEEVIFGDILEEEEADELSEISGVEKKKQKKTTKKIKDTFKVHKNGKAADDIKMEDNLNQKEEEELIVTKIPRKKKAKMNEAENYFNIEEGIDTVISLSELIDKKSGYTNSDMILMILEICLNAKKYGITSSNNTRKFWDEVYEKEEWENFLLTFKPETLRKYWRILRDTNDYKKIIDTVQSYANDLNYPGVKYRII